MICDGSTPAILFSERYFSARAARSSGIPGAGAYLVLPCASASAQAALINSGVSKSGSPAPNPQTSSPAALRALALASTARVGEGATLRAQEESGVGCVIENKKRPRCCRFRHYRKPEENNFGSKPSLRGVCDSLASRQVLFLSAFLRFSFGKLFNCFLGRVFSRCLFLYRFLYGLLFGGCFFLSSSLRSSFAGAFF